MDHAKQYFASGKSSCCQGTWMSSGAYCVVLLARERSGVLPVLPTSAVKFVDRCFRFAMTFRGSWRTRVMGRRSDISGTNSAKFNSIRTTAQDSRVTAFFQLPAGVHWSFKVGSSSMQDAEAGASQKSRWHVARGSSRLT